MAKKTKDEQSPAALAESKAQKSTPPEADMPPQPAPSAKPKGKTTTVKSDAVPDGPVLGTVSKPNTPCFDYDPKTMEPLMNGEAVLAEVEKKGVKIVITTGGRKIMCCTIPEYIDKFGPLPAEREIFEHFYPHAK